MREGGRERERGESERIERKERERGREEGEREKCITIIISMTSSVKFYIVLRVYMCSGGNPLYNPLRCVTI